MSVPSSLTQNPSCKSRQWRFTWETLAHISTLRLYLFPIPSRPSLSISNLSASLQLDLSLIVVSFDDQISLEIPVPKVLIDPDSKIECVVKSDYLEIKLNLMLPVDHPVVTDLNGDPSFSPLSLNDDMKGLSSEPVDLYCKSCSTKLTKEPLRQITEMPSTNWREAADNWFGNCCCSFGACSEILINNYLNSFNLSNNSLLNFSSIIVNKDSIFLPTLFNPQNNTHNNNNNNTINNNNIIINNNSHCCNGEINIREKIINNENNNIYLGGGFMLSENNISKDVNWVEFNCYKCNSPIGSYPCENNNSDNNVNIIDGGIRLFKCYISTSLHVGGSDDIFRRHTVQNLFSNLLLETAENEISFRTLVRDLNSKKPMLQIVLLSSSKTWCFSGSCFENRANGPGHQAQFRPVMKFLFSDADARLVEDWVKKYQAEEIYMHMSQIEELKKCLNCNLHNIPFSCSALQGMHLSWLEC